MSNAPSKETAGSKSRPLVGWVRAWAGWVRVDTDQVIRGWATDRNNRGFRPVVEVLVDGKPLAAMVADRLDAKLKEAGEGDGRYAFAVAIPAACRDGRAHAFEVRIRGSDFKLKVKAASFEVPPDAAASQIEIIRAGYGLVHGRVLGEPLTRGYGLELWAGGERLDAPVEVEWKANGVFFATFPAAVQDAAEGELTIAAPGMVEADTGAAAFSLPLGLQAEYDDDGLLVARIEGDPAALRGHALVMNVYRAGEAEPAASRPVTLAGPELRLPVGPKLAAGPLSVRLAVDGTEGRRLTATARRARSRLIRNADFSVWDATGPRDWIAGAGVVLDRGFYGFPDEVRAAQGVGDDFVHLEAPAAEGPTNLIGQEVGGPLAAGDRVQAALLVRASRAATVRMRLVDPAGAELASLSTVVRRAWSWTYAVETLDISRAAPGARIELLVDGGGPVSVDVAGARFGGARFSDVAPASPATTVANAAGNAELADWPGGVSGAYGIGRHETARDWFVVNRHPDRPTLARPLVGADGADRVDYLMATDALIDLCRLEIRLDSEAVEAMDRVAVGFDVSSPPAARRLLASAGLPEHLLIHRVQIVRRSHVANAQGFSLEDDTLALLGRGLLVTRRAHRFELSAPLVSSREASPFAWDDEQPEKVDHYLCFEFRRPFAVAFGDVRVGRADPQAADRGAGFLELEDRRIAVQAEHVRGLEQWLSPVPMTAGAGAPAPAAPPAALRWSWSALSGASLEVVICVHNAVEETLACLRSLMGASEVPHTVRIVDDASDPANLARIQAFVADKPWMRLAVNPENRGYTWSADRGVRESEADWVVLLNSDTVVTPGWLEGMLAAAASDPRIAFVGPLSNAASFQSVPDLYDSANQFAINQLPVGWTPDRMAALVGELSEKDFPQTPLLNGFCTLMRRSVFIEVGGLNLAAFPSGYGEENDLCTRVVKAGYRLAVADQVYVHHIKSASFGQARRTELAKAGGRALKELHPDVDYGALTAGFRDTPALVRLRGLLRGRLHSSTEA